MARIHPSFPLQAPTHLGAYRERDILRLLEQGLDNRFDVFHQAVRRSKAELIQLALQ